jgi:hypothetical protein
MKCSNFFGKQGGTNSQSIVVICSGDVSLDTLYSFRGLLMKVGYANVNYFVAAPDQMSEFVITHPRHPQRKKSKK